MFLDNVEFYNVKSRLAMAIVVVGAVELLFEDFP